MTTKQKTSTEKFLHTFSNVLYDFLKEFSNSQNWLQTQIQGLLHKDDSSRLSGKKACSKAAVSSWYTLTLSTSLLKITIRRTAKLAAAFPNGIRCQKCLNMGHWSYECKEKRKYVHRSSRTKQLSKHLAEKSANNAESMTTNQTRSSDAGNESRIEREKRTKHKKKRRNSSSSSSSSESSDSSSDSSNSDSSSSGDSDSSSSDDDDDDSSTDGSGSGSSSGSESDGSSSSSKSSDSAYDQESASAPKKKKRQNSTGESSDGAA